MVIGDEESEWRGITLNGALKLMVCELVVCHNTEGTLALDVDGLYAEVIVALFENAVAVLTLNRLIRPIHLEVGGVAKAAVHKRSLHAAGHSAQSQCSAARASSPLPLESFCARSHKALLFSFTLTALPHVA